MESNCTGLNHLHQHWRWSGPDHFQTVHAVYDLYSHQRETSEMVTATACKNYCVQDRRPARLAWTRWTHLVTFQLHQRALAAARRSNMVKWSSPGTAVNWIIPAKSPGGQPSFTSKARNLQIWVDCDSLPNLQYCEIISNTNGHWTAREHVNAAEGVAAV